MERTPGASSSLCVHAKNCQILVRGKPFGDGAARVRSPVHTYAHLVHKPFMSGLQTIRCIRVYEALCPLGTYVCI